MQETFSLATNQSIMTCVDSIECNIRPVVLLVRARCRLGFVQWICGQESDARDIDKGHIIGNFSLVSLRCVTQLVVQFLLGMCTTHYNLLIPEPAKLQVGTNVSEADKSWIDTSTKDNPTGCF